jgi:hypothetical protein
MAASGEGCADPCQLRLERHGRIALVSRPPGALPRPLYIANEALAFLIELVMLAAFAWWGAGIGDTPIVSGLLGVGSPLAAAILWGLFAAPRARIRLPLAGVLAVKGLAFAAATAAIASKGRPSLAIGFAVVALVNTTIATVGREAAMRIRR